MAKSPNKVFIVGAGASVDVGLPTGRELKDIIAGKLGFEFEHRQYKSGDKNILSAFHQHVKTGGGEDEGAQQYVDAAWKVVDALPLNTSIDSVIDAQDNNTIEFVSKLAIVQSILEAERASPLYLDKRQNDSMLNFMQLDGLWHTKFVELLFASCRRVDIKKRFEGIAFINFNYDRCIEQFLLHALMRNYGMSISEAENSMQALEIYHPYGSVGLLHRNGNVAATSFGAEIYEKDLLSRAGEIKTYSEHLDDDIEADVVRRLVQNAKQLVFLGFAFHQQNMELINPKKPCQTQQVYASVHGVSDSDQAIVMEKIKRLIGKTPGSVNINLQHKKCSKFIEEFSQSLTFT